MDAAQLAATSDVLVYSAMAVYAAALVAFATDLSALGRAAQPVASGAVTAPADEVVPAVAAVGGGRGRAAADPATAAGGPPDLAERRRPAAGAAVALTVLAAVLHLGAQVARGLAAGRVPWSDGYEFAVTGSLVVTAVYLVLLRQRDLRWLGTFVVGAVLLTLGLGIAVFASPVAGLQPALQSWWLVIHVSVAFISSALLTVGFCVTVVQLVQARRELRRSLGEEVRGGRFMDALPASRELEVTAYRLHAVAFPLWTFTIVAGAIWAEASWGRYWGWDPKEVWSFVIFVVYAGYMHARATRGWDGSRAAWLAVAGFACLVFNFTIVNTLFDGLHSYA